MRHRFEGDSKPLKADVAAREAELAKTRPPKPKKVDLAKKEAERLAAEARRQQQTAARWAPLVVPAAVTPSDEAEVIPAPQLPEAIAPAEPMPATANAPASGTGTGSACACTGTDGTSGSRTPNGLCVALGPLRRCGSATVTSMP